MEAVIPPVFIALFFFIVNIATLEQLTASHPRLRLHRVPDGRPRSCSASPACRAPARSSSTCRTATSTGLLLTPVRRTCDPARSHGGRCRGRRRADDPDHRCSASSSACASRPARSACVVFIALASLWSLAFAGFGYAIALKTGNPAAVNSSFLLFFPFLFLTSSYVPRSRAVRLARQGRRAQPGDVPARRPALAGDAERLAVGRARQGAHRHRRSSGP